MVRLGGDFDVSVADAVPAADLWEDIKANVPDIIALLEHDQLIIQAAGIKALSNLAGNRAFER